MAEQYIKKNARRIVIDTPSGPRAFSGMSKTWHEKILEITAGAKKLRVGCKHIFLCEDGWKYADHLKLGDLLIGKDEAAFEVTKVEEQPGEFLYDLLDVDGGSAYIADGIIHHNCEFLSSDALLIDSMVLARLNSRPELSTDMGFKFWVDKETIGGQGETYLLSVDPATGNGRDFSAIQIFSFPALVQIAEWRSNEINVPLLYAKIKWALGLLSRQVGRGRAEVLWTFERNGIGEALAALYFNDEKQPEHAELVSDANDKLGLYTTGKTKILSCLQLKRLIERVSDGMTINSEITLFELKNFVAKGGTYEAKSGATDDSVMALVGITRLLKRLADYNDKAFKQLNEYVSPEDPASTAGDDEAMPFLVV